MNRAVDLRSPEFIASRRFFKPRFYLVLAVIGCILAVGGFFYGMRLFSSILHSEISKKDILLHQLIPEAKPLELFMGENALLEAKASLENDIRSRQIPMSAHLQSIREKAAGHRIVVRTITIDSSGILQIEGSGPDLQHIALFNQMLTALPFVTDATVASIEMTANQDYFFKINGTFYNEGAADNE